MLSFLRGLDNLVFGVLLILADFQSCGNLVIQGVGRIDRKLISCCFMLNVGLGYLYLSAFGWVIMKHCH